MTSLNLILIPKPKLLLHLSPLRARRTCYLMTLLVEMESLLLFQAKFNPSRMMPVSPWMSKSKSKIFPLRSSFLWFNEKNVKFWENLFLITLSIICINFPSRASYFYPSIILLNLLLHSVFFFFFLSAMGPSYLTRLCCRCYSSLNSPFVDGSV